MIGLACELALGNLNFQCSSELCSYQKREMYATVLRLDQLVLKFKLLYLFDSCVGSEKSSKLRCFALQQFAKADMCMHLFWD